MIHMIQELFGQTLSHEAFRVLYDVTKPLVIAAQIELSERERQYLTDNGDKLIEILTWAPIVSNRFGRGAEVPPAVSLAIRRARGEGVADTSTKMSRALERELTHGEYIARVMMAPDGKVDISESIVLELAFSNFAPENLGIIDYHGPHRDYGKNHWPV